MNYEETLLLDICKGGYPNAIDYTKINWENFLVQSIVHKVFGKVYQVFSNNQNVPKWFRVLLINTYNWQKEIGETRLREFAKVLSAIHSKGVDVIVLKGAFLVPNVYHDAGVRGFDDLDILVEEEWVQAVGNILRDELGYVQGEYDEERDVIVPCPQAKIKERASDEQHESAYLKVDHSHSVPIVFMVEVHRRLETVFDHTHLETKRLFEDKVAFNLLDTVSYRLSNENMITHLCYHNYWHTQSLHDIHDRRDILLRNYMDMYLFINNYSINWDKVLCLKKNTELWGAISYSLYFLNQIFGGVLDDDVLSQLDGTAIEAEEKNIYDRWIIKRRKRKPLGRYDTEFLTRFFALNRFETAVSCCDFSDYPKEAIDEYFYYFLHSAKLYNLEGAGFVITESK